ncbi:MAG: hypothetical protein FJZ01_06430 [Candidatus Sericytochromatia bacterium]|nr:hypothetical protein [Candidatus Tanganyikabacteria bacterium]
MNGTVYARTANAWAVVFALVLVAFIEAPERTGAFLTELANRAGLAGTIHAPTDNLWYVLALSLMVAVTALAVVSARTGDPGPYRSLLAAKLMSTFVFFLQAVTDTPAYLLCALGDGFVALTLAAAWGISAPHRERAAALRDGLVPDLRRRYPGLGPFYEVWFGKVNVGPGQAFWFRYTLLDGAVADAGTWAIWFDAAAGVVAGRSPASLGDLGGIAFEVPAGAIAPGRATGRAGEISWDLEIHGGSRRFDHVPPLVAVLGLARSRYLAPYCDARVSGTVRVGAREIAVSAAPGMIGHIFGSKSGHTWVWAHCNAFADAPDAVFEGLTARVILAGRPSPPLSSFVLWLDGRCYRFSSALGMLMARSRPGEHAWSFEASAGGATIEGEATAPEPGQVAVVTYTDTDGSHLWCRNSKLASLRIRLRDPARGIDRVLEARGTAAFEYVDRNQPDRPPDLR